MSDNFNAVSRIFAAFTQAKSNTFGGRSTALEVWGRTFGLKLGDDNSDISIPSIWETEEDTEGENHEEDLTDPYEGKSLIDRQFLTITLLNELRNEVKIARATMAETGIPSSKYTPVFDAVDASLDPSQLHRAWLDVCSRVDVAVLTSLDLFASLVPDDSKPITHSELTDLLNQLNVLEISILKHDFPNDIKQFLLDQLDILRTAARTYSIKGARSFDEAVGQFISKARQYGSINQKVAEDESAKQTMEKLQKIWSWFMTRASDANTVYTLIDIGRKLLGG